MSELQARLRGWRPAVAGSMDAVIAAVVLGLGLLSVMVGPPSLGTMPLPLAVAVTFATAGLIAFRRRRPVTVLVMVCALVLVEQAFGTSLNFGGFALLIGVYTVAMEAPRRTSLGVLAALPGYLIVGVLLYGRAHPTPPETILADFISAIAVFGVAWFGADSLRARRARTATLEARAERLEREQADAARVAVQNERALIARELHDVVAHSVSVMVIQATAARRVMDEHPAEAREALASIETSGREALVEMRRLLGILRTDDARAPLLPQQGLAALGTLIGTARASGVVAELSIQGEPRPLAPGIDLAAYRIVQEAVTNTIKHASPARATIRLAYEPSAVAIEVRDDGQRRSAAAPMAQGQVGHGLVGMEERVRLYGGDFEAGPEPSGGFRVRARIPTSGTAA